MKKLPLVLIALVFLLAPITLIGCPPHDDAHPRSAAEVQR